MSGQSVTSLTPVSSLSVENSDVIIAHSNNTIQPDETTDMKGKIETLAKELSIAKQLEIHGAYRRVKRKPVNELVIDVQIQFNDQRSFAVKALLDSGCTGTTLSKEFVRKNNISTKKVIKPIPVRNADGSVNQGGPITDYVEIKLTVNDHEERMIVAIAELGKTDLFIGYEWLKHHNPDIDWRKGYVKFAHCPPSCGYHYTNGPVSVEELVDESWEDQLFNTRTIDVDEDEEEVETLKSQIPDYIADYIDVFNKKSFDTLPEHRPYDHVIELTPDFKPSRGKIFRLDPHEYQAMKEFVEDNLKSGRIRPSKSPQASSFFFVGKKDGSLRPVQDYRELNKYTVKNRYPIPNPQTLVDRIKDATIFSKFDIRWGYPNIRMKEGEEWKAAFITELGVFEPTTMFFGLCNSPATFQNFMDDIFKDERIRFAIIIYIDDILVFSKDRETHQATTRRVMQILRENHLYLKIEKCTFDAPEVEFLGLIVGNGQIRMDPKKVAAITEWPVPKTVKEVQSFNGFCNFYRRFVKDYSKIVRPLTQLTGKAEWTWGPEQENAFNTLKNVISTEPVLALPQDNCPFRVEADSSNFAIGAVLSQKVDNKWRPVAFMSKALQEAERNYEIYDKELLAIVTALEEWRHYLLGASEPFEIWSDHQNLQYFRKPQKLNRRQARWYSELQSYDFHLIHKPGNQMTKPDILSRRADFERGKKDNSDIVMLKPEWFIETLAVAYKDEKILERIRESVDKDEGIVTKRFENNDKSWTLNEDGYIMVNDRLYVPNSDTLRDDIIRAHHDSPLSGHPGKVKTQELIERDYWWPRIGQNVKDYVKGCITCQRTKVIRTKPSNPLNPNEIPIEPWEIISVDLIGPLPESKGFNSIAVFVDRHSKMIHLAPTTVELTSEGMARLFRDHVFKLHGLPRKIISDRGPQFASKFMKDFCTLAGIEQNLSTAFHPQTDGQTERMNQEIEEYLRIFINHRQTDWAEWLPLAEFSYNDKSHSGTKLSPFFVNYGKQVNKGLSTRKQVSNESAEQFHKRMKDIHGEATSALKKAAETMKRFYDRTKGISIDYKIGDLVWLDATNIQINRPAKKLSDRRYGPFEILEKIGKASYRLKLPAQWKRIHPVFNEVLLYPYVKPLSALQKTDVPPPPDIIDNVEEYEVEEIVDSKMYRGKLKYLVHWKGYPIEERTWEPVENLSNSQEYIDEFHKKHPSAPRRTDTSQIRFHKIVSDNIPQRPMLFDWTNGKLKGLEEGLRTIPLKAG